MCKPFCSKVCNCGTVASKVRSASGEWPSLADDWKHGWTACSSVACVRPQNWRLANHLLREREALFTFLNCPGLEATNWRAEQAIRPMVVTRKVWGGDRTIPGARTQSVLGSILQTCRQQRRPVSSFLQKLICSSQPKVMDLTLSPRNS